MNNKICQTHSERIKEKPRTKYTECNKKVKTATRMNKRDFNGRPSKRSRKCSLKSENGTDIPSN